MHKGRMEALTDGVVAVILTLMVLELKIPHSVGLDALRPLAPLFLIYVLSFVNVGIYWNNHHHMLHVVQRINGASLWANMLLLFWLSLIPFGIGWMDQSDFASLPTAAYGVVLTLAAISYTLLQRNLMSANGCEASELAAAMGGGTDRKGLISLAVYLVAIALAFVEPWISIALYTAIALAWLIPDRRIESRLRE
jgi:uncharacterized membrane protein